MPILAIDVHYREADAIAAGISFDTWDATAPLNEYVSRITEISEYTPGQFYKRELPCIQQLITEHQLNPSLIIIDGYVFLDSNNRPGLGKHLFDMLDQKIPIIGVAKTAFHDAPSDFEIFRGQSKSPLFISSAGIALSDAKQHILSMHGKNILPALLKTVDQLCRTHQTLHS